MNFYIIRLFITVLGILFVDVATVWGLKKTFPQFYCCHKRGISTAFIIQSVLMVITFLIGGTTLHQFSDFQLYAWHSYLGGLMSAIYIPKAFYVFLVVTDCIIAKITKLYRRQLDILPRNSRRIIAKFGFYICIIFGSLILWGILYGRNNFSIDQVEVFIDDLPAAFHGYKIVQISDIHAGSFFTPSKRYQKVVDLINGQQPNIIVCTGDMVNNFAEEIIPLIPVFSQLDAPDGKYAILGNHDYSGYYDWDRRADSVANHNILVNAIEQMGFKLLNNKAVTISRYNNDRMALIGVENWGWKRRHPKRADVETAIKSVQNIPFKILLSHDPLYWQKEIEGKTDIVLTLSGHTHGMQAGIKFGKKRFSIASLLKFPYGAGLYQTGQQYLYVNSGLGVIGFPGRIGMPPEITVLSLWKSKILD